MVSFKILFVIYCLICVGAAAVLLAAFIKARTPRQGLKNWVNESYEAWREGDLDRSPRERQRDTTATALATVLEQTSQPGVIDPYQDTRVVLDNTRILADDAKLVGKSVQRAVQNPRATASRAKSAFASAQAKAKEQARELRRRRSGDEAVAAPATAAQTPATDPGTPPPPPQAAPAGPARKPLPPLPPRPVAKPETGAEAQPEVTPQPQPEAKPRPEAKPQPQADPAPWETEQVRETPAIEQLQWHSLTPEKPARPEQP